MGTSFRMGPGYFPTILSILMIGLGAVIAVQALWAPTTEHSFGQVPWRGLLLLIGAVLFFGFVVRGLGLAPAVLIVVLDDRLGQPVRQRCAVPCRCRSGLRRSARCCSSASSGYRCRSPVHGSASITGHPRPALRHYLKNRQPQPSRRTLPWSYSAISGSASPRRSARSTSCTASSACCSARRSACCPVLGRSPPSPCCCRSPSACRRSRH